MFRFSFESIWSGDDSLFYSTKKFIIIVIYIDHASSPWLPLSPFFSLTIPAMIIQQIPPEIRHKKVFWRKTSACRDGTLKNHPNKIGMTLSHHPYILFHDREQYSSSPWQTLLWQYPQILWVRRKKPKREGRQGIQFKIIHHQDCIISVYHRNVHSVNYFWSHTHWST